MLNHLELENVGPAKSMQLEFGTVLWECTVVAVCYSR